MGLSMCFKSIKTYFAKRRLSSLKESLLVIAIRDMVTQLQWESMNPVCPRAVLGPSLQEGP